MNTMPRIFAIGETVLDIIFENNKPVSSCIGGSMLNSAISLGRMHAPVSMITGYSQDQPGRMADYFLKINGVDSSLVKHYADGKTTISLAFLDDAKKASYQFYQEWPSQKGSLLLPDFTPGDLLLFGSVFSLLPDMRPYILQLLESAGRANVCSIYDPNFRTAHLNELEVLRPSIFSNISKAGIVRGSDEDFLHIFGLSDPDAVYSVIKEYCQNLIITQGMHEILLYTPKFVKRYSVPLISVLSTIGAGDSFNAGIIKYLFKAKADQYSIANYSEQIWDELISYGIACASAVCASKENYVPVGFNPAN
jgi:fructokinase